MLSAYPAAMTPGCTTQASDFRDNVMFPLLADSDHTVLTAYGAWKDKKLYGKTVTGVIRYNVKATGHVAKLMRELDMTTASG